MEPVNTAQKNQSGTHEQLNIAQQDAQETNAQIIERLKEQRDELRGINNLGFEVKTKKPKFKKLVIILLSLVSLSLTYIFLIKPNINKTEDSSSATQKSFMLPSNINTKTSEEKQALNIILLARNNKADEIITDYLNKAQLGTSEEDFKKLINSYSLSADGEQVDLIEKKVGKVNFSPSEEGTALPETNTEFEAASLLYRSSYYRHTNNLYLKINLYKPDPTVDNWKLYTFEFKAGDRTPPIKAEINVAV
ncbi:MAG: hypothetical protein H6799_02110 [Candidatus Nomurabacteria bacterium]|nr:MAG: hypothetical protein H6799_02110 [Candidatus Nomurabacteria bacterium]